MSDEDFEPFVGGPPPDPSERTWRHPSEIAAQAHAESMAEFGRARSGTRANRSWRPTGAASLIMAGSLGAAACLAGLALFQSTSFQSTASQSTASQSTASQSTASQSTASQSTAFQSTAFRSAVARVADSVDSVDVAVSGNEGAGGLSPTTTVSTTPPAVSALVTSTAEAHLAPITIGADQVANGVLVDGYLITSASAVGNQLSVSYRHQDTASLAYLVGIDPFSDLAVFRPSRGSRAGSILEALSASLVGESASTDLPTVTPGSNITLAGLTDDGVQASSGSVIAVDRGGTTSDGRQLIGLIDTSIRRPDQAGSLLLTPDGAIVGIVVDTASSLSSAIPVQDAIAIADRLAARGWANETWIGFVGIDIDTGVEVVDVTPGGPADTAGLQPGDVILFLDGAPIEHMGGITAGLRRASPGDTIIIVVERLDELIAIRAEASAYRPEDVNESVDG